MLINTVSGKGEVLGVTSLHDEVFLIRKGTPEVEVYNADTLKLLRRLPVKRLLDPQDMTSSVKYSCLYVADTDQGGSGDGSVHRVELRGKITRWTVNDWPEGVSATYNGWNVLVTCLDARKLKEYTTHGDIVREIALEESVTHPQHSVQLRSGQFIVCHDWYTELHRLCIVGVEGRVTKSYGGPPGSAAGQVDVPLRLVVDRQGYILVADVNNKRVLLSNASLDDVRELVTEGDVSRPWTPGRLCLDEKRGRLYVAEWNSDDVLVLQVKDLSG